MPATDSWKTIVLGAVGTGEVALHTTTPTSSDPGIEVTGGTYARQPATIVGNTSMQGVSQEDLTFAGLPACTVTAISFHSPYYGMMFYAPLTPPRTYEAGDTAIIPAGNLIFTVT